jgi:hypothetical protein
LNNSILFLFLFLFVERESEATSIRIMEEKRQAKLAEQERMRDEREVWYMICSLYICYIIYCQF